MSVQSAEPLPAGFGGSLDEDALAELRDLGAEEFDALIQLFLDDGATKVAALRSAHAAGSATEIAALAHGLKGMAITFGAATLAVRCEELQMHAGEGDPSITDRLIDSTADEFGLAGAAVRRELHRGGEVAPSA